MVIYSDYHELVRWAIGPPSMTHLLKRLKFFIDIINYILEKINLEDIINNFAFQKTRRYIFTKYTDFDNRKCYL